MERLMLLCGRAICAGFWCALALGGNLAAAAASAVAAGPAAGAEKPFVLHLNGIGGERTVDHWLIEGLKAGGVNATFEYYDWTGGQIGIEALQGKDRHVVEARKIAAKLVERFQQDPKRPIYITCHSGGCGMAVWALELLPPEVKVQSVFMFAPALAPGYDLTRALRHIKGKLHVFSSSFDVVVLGTGTKLFGTIDGQRVEAAGLKGFTMPKGADAKQYAKLVPHPYKRSWAIRYWNDGSHIGCLRPLFARDYVAPIFLTGAPPKDADDLVATAPPAPPATPTTRPAAPAGSSIRSTTVTPSTATPAMP